MFILETSGHPRKDVPREWVLDGINFFGTFKELSFDEKGFARFACSGNQIAGHSEVASIRVSQQGVHSFAQVVKKESEVSEETDDSLRERILLSLRKQKRLGTIHDYIAWTLEVPGVQEAFVLPGYLKSTEDLGKVYISWLSKDRKHTQGLRDDIEKHIRSKAPVSACVMVESPRSKVCEIKIKLKSENTENNRKTIERELKEHFQNVSKPGKFFNKNSELVGNLVSKSELSAIISKCQGGRDHEITVQEDQLLTGYLEFLECRISFV